MDNLVRLELTLQFRPAEAAELQSVAQELEAALLPEKWEALVALCRAVVRQTEELQPHYGGVSLLDRK